MMLAGVVAIIGVLIVLLLLHNILDTKKHMIFQLLILVFIMTGALLILPKAVIDSQTVCEPVIDQIEVIGVFSYYNYTDFCYSRPETTGQTFYNITTTMFYLFIGYFIVFLAFWSFMKLSDSVKGRKQ